MAAQEFRLRDALVFGFGQALRAPLDIVVAVAAVAAGVGAAIWVAAPAVAAVANAAVEALDGPVRWDAIARDQGVALASSLVLALAGFAVGDILTLRALTPRTGNGFPRDAITHHPRIALVKALATWPVSVAVVGLTVVFALRMFQAEQFGPSVLTAVSGLLFAFLLHGAVSVRLSSAPAFAASGDGAPLLSAWRRSAALFWSLSLAHIVVLAGSAVWIAGVVGGAGVVIGADIVATLADVVAGAGSRDASAALAPDDALRLGAIFALLWIGPRVLGQGVHAWFVRSFRAGQAAAAREAASIGAR